MNTSVGSYRVENVALDGPISYRVMSASEGRLISPCGQDELTRYLTAPSSAASIVDAFLLPTGKPTSTEGRSDGSASSKPVLYPTANDSTSSSLDTNDLFIAARRYDFDSIGRTDFESVIVETDVCGMKRGTYYPRATILTEPDHLVLLCFNTSTDDPPQTVPESYIRTYADGCTYAFWKGMWWFGTTASTEMTSCAHCCFIRRA